MEKYIILGTDGTFIVIVHACPHATGKFQWYLVDKPNSEKKYILEGQTHESFIISSDNLCAEYLNKWLCCKCEIGNDSYIEGYVYFTSDFVEMIKTNYFDMISFFDEDGNIQKELIYYNSQQ